MDSAAGTAGRDPGEEGHGATRALERVYAGGGNARSNWMKQRRRRGTWHRVTGSRASGTGEGRRSRTETGQTGTWRRRDWTWMAESNGGAKSGARRQGSMAAELHPVAMARPLFVLKNERPRGEVLERERKSNGRERMGGEVGLFRRCSDGIRSPEEGGSEAAGSSRRSSRRRRQGRSGGMVLGAHGRDPGPHLPEAVRRCAYGGLFS